MTLPLIFGVYRNLYIGCFAVMSLAQLLFTGIYYYKSKPETMQQNDMELQINQIPKLWHGSIIQWIIYRSVHYLVVFAMWVLMFEAGYHSLIGFIIFIIEMLAGIYATYEWYTLVSMKRAVAHGHYFRMQ